jgi:hypothetical protein
MIVLVVRTARVVVFVATVFGAPNAPIVLGVWIALVVLPVAIARLA